MIYFVDIDGTICTDTGGDYAAATPIQEAIDRVNSLHDQGHEIIYWTARGTTSGIDYAELCRTRKLHLVNLDEARELSAGGIDIQLHTHNHRISLRQERFTQELADNRARIEPLSQGGLRHFCYPSGYTRPEFLPWLRAAGIDSATTCEPGLASPNSDPLLLPRLVDSNALSRGEFAGWVSGVAAWLPKRPSHTNEGHLLQLMDDELDPQWLDQMQGAA